MPSPSSPRPRRRTPDLPRAAFAILLLALALGCQGGAARDLREWRWLAATKRALDAERDALAALPPAPAGSPAHADAERRGREAASRAAEYQRRLQRFLEKHGPEAGQPMSPEERAALHMRSDEEVRAARDFIARAGDYRQAIEICRSALDLDPGYPPLERLLAAAEADRYVTPERFAKVKPGMTPAAVRALLGPPNLHNVRDYPQRSLVAWFYPKDETGAAAAVWFQRIANAPGPVFQADFDAVDPRRDAPRTPAPPAPAPASTG
jgi:tetratricopeptide (TPR) repeat protein